MHHLAPDFGLNIDLVNGTRGVVESPGRTFFESRTLIPVTESGAKKKPKRMRSKILVLG